MYNEYDRRYFYKKDKAYLIELILKLEKENKNLKESNKNYLNDYEVIKSIIETHI
jgi:hypothetical protein